MLAAVSLLLFSSCTGRESGGADMMNDSAYAFYYRNRDSVVAYAHKAMALSQHNNYSDGEAEALNHLAFTDICKLDFNKAQQRLDSAVKITDNQLELMTAYVQKMHIDRLLSRNRDFYTHREKADACHRRINEEKEQLTPRQQKRRIYVESEYNMVCAGYYNVLGQGEKALRQLQSINSYGEIRQDTAQYLKYVCMLNARGINYDTAPEAVGARFSELVNCLGLSRKQDYICMASMAMLRIGEYLLMPQMLQYLESVKSAGITYINPNGLEDRYIAAWNTETALLNFEQYGDDYHMAEAYLHLATCCIELQEYNAAIDCLDRVMALTNIQQVRSLMADVHEQYSVAFSALDNKQQSDYHRNLFLDFREETRQDRYFESRAEQLDIMSVQLNIMIASVMIAILILVFLLYYFNKVSKRAGKDSGVTDILKSFELWKNASDEEKANLIEQQEELQEQLEVTRIKLRKGEEDNLEARAKLQMIDSIMPLIDRMRHEVRMLKERHETDEQQSERRKYIAELAAEIDRNNAVLTRWIELRQGQLRLHIETFPLQPLFDMMEKNKSSFAAKGITLNVVPATSVVKADRVLTLFMVNTLADNARKFTPRGGTVTIDSIETDSYVEIAVTDTGCGLTEAERDTVFTHKIHSGHGFGLLNCRGIIEKYKKLSRLFAPCTLGVESGQGSGSRFYFRLPRGVVRMTVALMTLCTLAVESTNAENHNDNISNARRYADSAYYSNIAATYQKTIIFSDSCRKYLNAAVTAGNTTATGKRKPMLRDDDGSAVTPEIQWFRDSVGIDFNVILDIRNETAVAALALHDWRLYDYNNRIYTQLFQEMSADNTLGQYCRMVERQQTNKNVTIIMLVLVLIMILPAYYFLFYRKRLMLKREQRKLKSIEIDKLKEEDTAGKNAIRDENEILADECRLMENTLAELHISNSVLDNCLSTIKHETMYYPSRIAQMLEKDKDTDIAALDELVNYYRNIYAMLGMQARSQTSRSFMQVRHIRLADILPQVPGNVFVIADKAMLEYLFRMLRRQNRDAEFRPEVYTDRQSVIITTNGSFTNSTDYMLCRQILREHGEATAHRACGIRCDEGKIIVTLRGYVK